MSKSRTNAFPMEKFMKKLAIKCPPTGAKLTPLGGIVSPYLLPVGCPRVSERADKAGGIVSSVRQLTNIAQIVILTCIPMGNKVRTKTPFLQLL